MTEFPSSGDNARDPILSRGFSHQYGAVFPPHTPVIAICGYSGSGKTTLIEHLIPMLREDGLSIAVVKHDSHGLRLDTDGKDTDRFFHAGAAAFIHDPTQSFLRLPLRQHDTMEYTTTLLLQEHDLVFVEGHRETPLPLKIWVHAKGASSVPPEAGAVMASLDFDADRPALAYRIITAWLQDQVKQRPVCAGVLIGGRSTRMGSPKHLIERDGKTWLEWEIEALSPHVLHCCLLGAGEIPASLSGLTRLPDIPETTGPIAGMVAAMRWRPDVDWIFTACDMPCLTGDAVSWLLGNRIPGRWAVFPRQPESAQIEPLCAWYDRRMRHALEHAEAPIEVSNHPKAAVITIPTQQSTAWRNVNSLK